MTTLISNARRSNPSTAFLVAGLVLTLLVVMFRPSGATASLPEDINIFPSYNALTGEPIPVDAVEKTSGTYNIKFQGEKKTTPTVLEGVSIVDMLKKANVDVEKVPFVKIRICKKDAPSCNDGRVALFALALDKTTTPPMIINSWRGPNGKLPTPSIAPAQVDESQGISQAQIAVIARDEKMVFVPAKEGAQLMGVQVKKSKTTSKGEYRLTASVTANKAGSLDYVWYSSDAKGNYTQVGKNSPHFTTTDATQGTSIRNVNVVVTSRTTGSTGAGFYAYKSKKLTDGKKGDPFPDPTPSTGATGGGGTPGGQGFGGGGGSGGTVTPAPGTVTPSPSTPITPVQPPVTPPTTQPTEPTTQPEQTTDTSGITNVAQNVNPTGSLRTVTGVLLSAPSIPAAAGGSGSPITELPEPVATAATTLFQPVDDPGDLWPYLLTILFALCFTGAVREWVNP